jgi:hypothetical protein
MKRRVLNRSAGGAHGDGSGSTKTQRWRRKQEKRNRLLDRRWVNVDEFLIEAAAMTIGVVDD